MAADRSVVPAVGWLIAGWLAGCNGDGGTGGGLDCVDADSDAYCAEGDCDDSDPTRYPGAEEIVGDEIDSDCDNNDLCYADADDDGHRTELTVESRDLDCTDLGEGTADLPADDCDDDDFLAYPGATEAVGDGVDSDCDGIELCYVDADQDGFHSGLSVPSDDLDCDDLGESPFDDPLDCNDQDAGLNVLKLAKLIDDFSQTENEETSLWSYRYTSTLDADAEYQLMPGFNLAYLKDDWDPGPQPRLWSVTANQTPWMGRNDSGSVQGLINKVAPVNLVWADNTFAVAPGRTAKAVVGWRAEVAGTAAVTASFSDIAPENDGVEWTIEHDGVALATGELDASGGSVSSGEVFIDNFTVDAGDFIYFVVDPRGPGVDLCATSDVSCNDATEVDLTVALCASE
jgi:Putative metal-binding motif